MMELVEGKSALMTGAAQGICRGVATALAKAGAKLVFVDRNSNDNQVAGGELRTLGSEAIALTCDISYRKDVGSTLPMRRAVRQHRYLCEKLGRAYHRTV